MGDSDGSGFIRRLLSRTRPAGRRESRQPSDNSTAVLPVVREQQPTPGVTPASTQSFGNDPARNTPPLDEPCYVEKRGRVGSDGTGTVSLQAEFPSQKSKDGENAAPEVPVKKGVAQRFGGGIVRFWEDLWNTISGSWVNILLIFVPAGIAVDVAHLSPSVIFAINAVAIVPLAGLLTHATESVSHRLGDTLGALMNVSFGNAVELIIFIIALAKNEIRIVQASLLGSILANLLLILGMSFLVGGLRYQEQIYNNKVTQMSACMLSLSVMSLLLPTAFHASFANRDHAADTKVLQISRGTSVILLFVYALYLLFQLKSHAYMYESTPQQIIDQESHPGVLADILDSSISDDDGTYSSSPSSSSSRSHRTARTLRKAFYRTRKSSMSSYHTGSMSSVASGHSVEKGKHYVASGISSLRHPLAARRKRRLDSITSNLGVEEFEMEHDEHTGHTPRVRDFGAAQDEHFEAALRSHHHGLKKKRRRRRRGRYHHRRHDRSEERSAEGRSVEPMMSNAETIVEESTGPGEEPEIQQEKPPEKQPEKQSARDEVPMMRSQSEHYRARSKVRSDQYRNLYVDGSKGAEDGMSSPSVRSPTLRSQSLGFRRESRPRSEVEPRTSTGDSDAPSIFRRRSPAIGMLRPSIPKVLTQTVFTNPPPSAAGSTVTSPVVVFPRGNPSTALRRSNSMPDRLSRQRASALIGSQSQLPGGENAETTAEGQEDPPEMCRSSAVSMLLLSTALVAVCAEFLVDAIPEMTAKSKISQAFIGLIVLPIVGNAAEHVTAVTVATKNKMDLAIGVAVGSSIQIALFVTPLIVLLGWVLEKEMSLLFTLFETVSLFVTAFVVNFLVLDGRSNYLEGALLISAYTIIGVAAFFYPNYVGQSDGLGA